MEQEEAIIRHPKEERIQAYNIHPDLREKKERGLDNQQVQHKSSQLRILKEETEEVELKRKVQTVEIRTLGISHSFTNEDRNLQILLMSYHNLQKVEFNFTNNYKNLY